MYRNWITKNVTKSQRDLVSIIESRQVAAIYVSQWNQIGPQLKDFSFTLVGI